MRMEQLMGKRAQRMVPLIIDQLEEQVLVDFLDQKGKKKWEELELRDLLSLLQMSYQINSGETSRNPASTFSNSIQKVSFTNLQSTNSVVETVSKHDKVLSENCGFGDSFIDHSQFTYDFQKVIVENLISEGFSNHTICKYVKQHVKNAKQLIMGDTNPYLAWQRELVKICKSINTTLGQAANILNV